MKKLTPALIILALILFSCDGPVSNLNKTSESVNVDQQGSAPLATLSQMQPAEVDSVRNAVVQQFKAQHGEKWQVTWTKESGTPLSVFSGTTIPMPGPPEQAARTFLSQNRSLFNMRSDLKDLELIEVVQSSRGIRHVRFRQTHDGVPVHNATYQVHIRPDGSIDMANGQYFHSIETPTSPGVSASRARKKVLSDLGGKVELIEGQEKERKIETMLMIYRLPEEKSFTLAWKVLVPAAAPNPGTWQFFVDAGSGQILEKLNLNTTITGDGDIIEDTPYLTPTPVTRNLYRLDGSGYLRGTYANVHNEVSSRAYSSNNSFQYNQSNTHFDEANVYYHIDTYRAGYLDDLGFNSDIGSDQDLEAYVHDQDEPNNAHYSPSREAVIYGENLATTDVVIYHEFIHAVVDVVNWIYYFSPNEDEEGAIGEGLADYFPGSHEDRSEHGTRDMANPDIASYSEYQNDPQYPNVEEHIGGEFFSAILWDLRNAGGISHHHADEIIFEAILRVSDAPTFLEYRNAIMATDDFIHGGNHNDLIQNTFAARGVGSYAPLGLSIDGPQSVKGDKSATWTAKVSAENVTVDYYSWSYRKRCAGITHPCSWSNWSLLGQNGSRITENFYNKVDVPAQVELKVHVGTSHQDGNTSTLIGVYSSGLGPGPGPGLNSNN